MITCPNINSKEWKELENEVGEPEAIKLFALNGEKIPSLEEVEALRNPINNKIIPSEVTQEIQKIIELRKATQLSLNTSFKIYNNKVKALKRKGKGKKKKVSKSTEQLLNIVDDLKISIKKFEQADTLEAINIFLNNANKILGSVEMKQKQKQAQKKELQANLKSYTLGYSDSQINKALELLRSYDVMDNLGSYLNTTDDLEAKEKEDLMAKLNELQSRRDAMIDVFMKEARSVVADKLAGKSTIMTKIRHRELTRKYKEENPKKNYNLKIDAWETLIKNMVDKQITKELPALQAKERNHIYDMLSTAPGDVSNISAWLVDPRNITEDVVVQTTVALLDRASSNIRLSFLKTKSAFVKEFEKFVKDVNVGRKVGITDQRELYKNMIEKDKDGNYTGYYTRELKFEFYEDSLKIKQELEDIEYNLDVLQSEYSTLEEDSKKNAKRLSEIEKEFTKLGEKQIKLKQDFINKYKTAKPKTKAAIREWESTSPLWYDKATNDYRLNKYIKPEVYSQQYKDLKKDKVRFNFYETLRTFNKKSDFMIEGSGKGLHMKLPSILSKGNEIISREESLKDAVKRSGKRKLADLRGITADDPEYGDLANLEEKDIIKVMGTQSGEQYKSVSIPFRGKIPIEEQSFDLAGMALTNRYVSINYREKNELKDTLELARELVKTRDVEKVAEGSLKKMHQVVKKTFKIAESESDEITRQLKETGEQSNSFKLLSSVIEDRLYGLSSIPGGKVMGLSIDKLTSTAMAFAANQMLMLNWGSDSANLTQGKFMNFLGGVKGDIYNRKNIRRGEKKYLNPTEMVDNLKDVGKLTSTSKTNILMQLFIGDSVGFDGFVNDFTQDSQIKRIGKIKNLHSIGNMVEHYIQGTLMYSIFDTYKLTNGKTDENNKPIYVDINNNIVDEKDAATLDDIFEVDEKGDFTIKEGFYTPKLGKLDNVNDIVYKVSRLIQDVSMDLQGNYSNEQKAMVQRRWYGKLGFFLKKFVIRGMQSRWKGLSQAGKSIEDLPPHLTGYSESLGDFKEGTYVTIFRFLKELKNHQEKLTLELLSLKWDSLTPSERGNIKQAIFRTGFMLAALVGAKLLADLASEEDDEKIWYAAYLSRRMWNELFFFTPFAAFSGEAVRFIETPTAALNIMKTTGLLIDSLIDDFTSFEFQEFGSGRRKGEYKSWVYLNKVLNPFYKNFVDYSYRDKYNFAANAK